MSQPTTYVGVKDGKVVMMCANLVNGAPDLGIPPDPSATANSVSEAIENGQNVYLMPHSEIPEMGADWPPDR